jgi:hypothetical protein
MNRLFRTTVSFVVFVLLATGCKGSVTPIKTLLDDPGSHDHQTVRVAGTVSAAVGILGYGAYQLDDGTGILTVVTKEGGAPREGTKVGVEGEFRSGFTLGTQTQAVLVESRRFTP